VQVEFHVAAVIKSTQRFLKVQVALTLLFVSQLNSSTQLPQSSLHPREADWDTNQEGSV